MSARRRKRGLDARQCRLANLHIAYSMPGWSFASDPDDLKEVLSAMEKAVGMIEAAMKATT